MWQKALPCEYSEEFETYSFYSRGNRTHKLTSLEAENVHLRLFGYFVTLKYSMFVFYYNVNKIFSSERQHND